MELIFKTKFGSHLYGTATEMSDTDYKGIYLPNLNELILQKTSKSINNITKKDCSQKNTSDDIDYEIYSLHYFLELAYKGETCALDMIHTPDHFEEIRSQKWAFIRTNRSRFYTKNLKAYIGYCKMQASKYGIKGSRLSDAESILKFLKDKPQQARLSHVWNELPQGENIKKIEIEDCDGEDKRAIEVCSRKLMATTPIQYAIESIQKFYENYGQRAQQAKDNKGIDWKAISHAFRAGLQLKEIYETGDLIYPLKDAEFLVGIKKGKYHYQDDGISQKLENLVDEINVLAEKSTYPEKCDRSFWESWLVSLY